MISLKTNNIQEPNLKSRLLMQYILNKPRQYMLIHDNEELTNKQEKAYLENIEKMIKGVPLQHITHSQEFMKMNFYVNENVLIPRPDTEILVEEVINIAKKTNAKKILDLCTGSGAIAISLAKYIENSQITAVDISEEALRIAKLNATDEEIKAACQKASVHEFIMTLPQGYDTQVGELGDTLSGGERQRIGLARAFLHDAPFMLLDEPTSNLDSLNEAVILRSLHEERNGKTVVLVSHRESTMRIADKIYSVEHGRMS